MKAQTRHFGEGGIIRALLAILFRVLRILYIVLGVMRLGGKKLGLVRDPTVSLHVFQCKLSLSSKLCKLYVGINHN